MTRLLLLWILNALGYVTVTTSQESLEAVLCEGSGRLPLTCPDNKIILPSSAFFGRDDVTTCLHPTAAGNTNCKLDTATEIFKQMCEGKSRCEIDARTEFFGDPCPGTYKYLRLNYTCVDCVNTFGDDLECEFWRLFGQCQSDQEWMMTNCRKACMQCDPTPPACVNVFPADDECPLWAARGDCANNPAWMTVYCRKACQRCDQRTDCSVNKFDVLSQANNCSEWYADGECTNNAGFMLGDCTRECFNCQSEDVVRCENKYGNDTACDVWTQMGQCKTNPGFMIPFCYKACTECTQDPPCVNIDPDDVCEAAFLAGNCTTDLQNMYKYCWKSCMQCQDTPECVNKHGNDIECDYWALSGEVQNNYAYMRARCALSYSNCDVSRAQRKDCENIYGIDTSCDAWALDGDCYQNPGWMFAYCRKSCTLCDLDSIKLKQISYDPFPGLLNAFSRHKTLILAHTFPVAAQLTHFMAYFGTTDSIFLEVWRPTSWNTFESVYSKYFTPVKTDVLQTVITDGCVMVQPGDRLGFTFLLNRPSPLTSKFDLNNIKKTTSYRGATSKGNFINIRYPYVFALAAGYDDVNLCP